MKTRIVLTLFAASLSAQTVTVNLAVPMQVAVLGDIHQHFLGQTTGTIGVLSADMDGTTASVTVTLDQSKLTAQAPPYAVGNAVLMGIEPMKITGVAGQQLTLSRG